MIDDRTKRLMPAGVPRYVRIYDNGGESIDRYTVVFTDRYRHKTGGETWVLAMNARPFHPQGFGQHCNCMDRCDVNKWGYPPAMGRKNHLGRRIPFNELPLDCQKFVLQDYRELWDINQA